MITGAVTVNRTIHEAKIRLMVSGPNGQSSEIDAVIDTGFSGFLTLPPPAIKELGLPKLGVTRIMLADGSECLADLHAVTVLWDGRTVCVESDCADTDPLIGMSLLAGYDLHIRIREGGPVTIAAIG